MAISIERAIEAHRVKTLAGMETQVELAFEQEILMLRAKLKRYEAREELVQQLLKQIDGAVENDDAACNMRLGEAYDAVRIFKLEDDR